jgi:uncharacterized membrane protein YkvA (DUF1232 family)
MLYLAYKDPRIPWYAKVIIVATVAYSLSPIDLIPDFIPIIGYLDDLFIVPVGIALSIKMIPKEVLEEYRQKAKAEPISTKSKWVVAVIIVLIWLFAAFLIFKFARKFLK